MTVFERGSIGFSYAVWSARLSQRILAGRWTHVAIEFHAPTGSTERTEIARLRGR